MLNYDTKSRILHRVMVYENGQQEEQAAFAGGWSTADSGRIAWFARGIDTARCKIPTPPELD